MTASQPPDDHRAAAEVPRTSGHPPWVGSRRSASSKMRPTTVAVSSVTLAVSHLFFATGAWAGCSGSVSCFSCRGRGCRRGCARPGRRRRRRRPRPGVCGCVSRPWTAAWTASWWPRLRLWRWPGAAPRAHDDALTVGGQDQHFPAGTGRWSALGVEVVDVGRGPPGECFGLAFAQPDPGGPFDRRGAVVEGAPRRFEGGQLPQAVRVLLHRQVQRGVGGIQVGVTAATVGLPGHRHLAEHRGQRAGMPGLDGTAGLLPGVGHLLQALLALRPQLQVILHQLAEQFATGLLQVGLQVGMLQAGGLGAVEETQRRLKQRAAGGEALVHTGRRRPGHRRPAPGHRRPGHRRPRRAASRPMSAARPASPAAASSASAAR